MHSLNDHELLRDYLQNGAQNAFTQLVERHVSLVYSTACRLVRDPHLAEDVTQQVFTLLARKAARLGSDTVLSAWLYRTARYVASEALRRDVRWRRHEQFALENMNRPTAEAIWRQTEPLLDEAMAKLSAADHDAIVLRYFENRTLKEIGATLGASEDAVQKRVARALDRLRTSLTRKGVTASAVALGTAIASNALQAAPPGLAASVAAASVTAAKGGAALALLKCMAVTKTQAATIGLILVASVMAPLVVQNRTHAQLHSQGEALDNQAEQLAALKAENHRLAGMLVRQTNPGNLSGDQFREVLKLRGEVSRLTSNLREFSQPKPVAPLSRSEQLASIAQRYREHVSRLKQFLEANPSERIPELELLTEEDWLFVAGKEASETKESYQRAMSLGRLTAESNVARGVLRPALRQYAQDHGGQTPPDLTELKPYLQSPIDEVILRRWQVFPGSKLAKLSPKLEQEPWVISQKAPVNAALDHRVVFSPNTFILFGGGPENEWDIAP